MLFVKVHLNIFLGKRTPDALLSCEIEAGFLTFNFLFKADNISAVFMVCSRAKNTASMLTV